MKKFLKYFLIVFGVIIASLIFLVCLPRVLAIFAKDASSVDETGLEINLMVVASSSNAYYDLEKIKDVIYPVDGTGSSSAGFVDGSKDWDQKEVEDILLKNTETLQLFTDAANKISVQDPNNIDLSKVNMDTPVPHLNSWRASAFINSLQAINLAKQGKGVEAVNESIKSIKIGNMIMNSNGPLLSWLVGIAVKNIGLNSIKNIVEISILSNEDLKKIESELSPFVDNGTGLKNSFIIEYIRTRSALDLMVKETNKNYYFELNKSKQLRADSTKWLISKVDVDCADVANIKAPEKKIPSLYLSFFYENAAGKILNDIVIPSTISAFKKRCESNLKLLDTINLIKSKINN